MTTAPLPARAIAPGVHVLEAPQRFYGVEVGTRMTVLETENGLLLHSPLDVNPDDLRGLGTPRWVLAPNLLHHLYVGRWAKAGVETWAAPGLEDKRPDVDFHATITSGTEPFGPDIEVCALTCLPMTNEVLLLHRPSRTLVVTDLVFHFTASAPWFTRAAMRCLGGHPGCKTTLLERALIRRDVGRREIAHIAQWDFDRVIMAHGEVIESGGKAAFLGAFGWLL